MRSLPLLALFACSPAGLVPPGPPLDTPGPALQEGSADLTVWFAPDDDLLPIELAEIDRVRLARLADPVSPADAYAIRYAVYNLRHEAIVQGLVDARDAGVSVQVLIDADQLDPARDWNWADEFLTLEGFSFAPDHRVLDGSVAAPDLVGIAGTGLMHLKTRIYRTPDATRVLTGSHNPGEDAMVNDETLHLVRDPQVVAAYERAFADTLADRDPINEWTEGAPVNVLFGPSGGGVAPNVRLLDWIAAEDEQILVIAYSLRDVSAPGHPLSLLALLEARHAAGVPVLVLTDRKQSDAWGDATEDRLRDAGIPVYEATNATTEFTAMHPKSVVLGRTAIRVITDTANLTAAGFGTASRKATNQESTLFVESFAEDGRIGRRYLAHALRMFARYADQSAPEGEAPYAELEPWLLAQPGWPLLPVGFSAQVETSFGERVHVSGDRPELGGWGAAGPGIELGTDGDLYPWWTSEPVLLPLGARFAHKLTATDGTSVRWEAGPDRQAHAVPDPSGAAEVCTQSHVWR